MPYKLQWVAHGSKLKDQTLSQSPWDVLSLSQILALAGSTHCAWISLSSVELGPSVAALCPAGIPVSPWSPLPVILFLYCVHSFFHLGFFPNNFILINAVAVGGLFQCTSLPMFLEHFTCLLYRPDRTTHNPLLGVFHMKKAEQQIYCFVVITLSCFYGNVLISCCWAAPCFSGTKWENMHVELRGECCCLL